jgi:8-oxo-dGTP pyrophosphatase MutT (NUDIX family)
VTPPPPTSRDRPLLPDDPFAEPGEVAATAATVIPVRDGPDGLETLLVRRNRRLAFAGGLWVWPGGRVERDDAPVAPTGSGTAARLEAARHLERAARRAAVREAAEEAGLDLDAGSLVWFSHWTPPGAGAGAASAPARTHRFRTFFFLAALDGPRPTVRIDDEEIHDHRWATPSRALADHAAGTLGLSPPTFITLSVLATHGGVDDLVTAVLARDPEVFATSFAAVEGGAVALYHGDTAYPGGDPATPGPRHRLWMLEDGWRYERSG